MKVFLIHSIFIFFTLLSFSQAQPTGNIEIRITGLRNSNGTVNVNLFNNKEGFPDDPLKSFGWRTVKIFPDTVVIVFEDLPFGDYAVSVLHDENCNGRMEKNFFGIPREGFAFTNNYAPGMKSPSFHDAMFALKKSKMQANLKMIYY